MKKSILSLLGAVTLIISSLFIFTGCGPKVASIEISQEFQTFYQLGENVNTAGGIITVTYENEKTESVAITNDMVSSFTNDTVGQKNMIITYGGQTCEVSYTVTGVKPTEDKYLFGSTRYNDLYLYLIKNGDNEYIWLEYYAYDSTLEEEWIALQDEQYVLQVMNLYQYESLSITYNTMDHHYYVNNASNSYKVTGLDNFIPLYLRYIPA